MMRGSYTNLEFEAFKIKNLLSTTNTKCFVIGYSKYNGSGTTSFTINIFKFHARIKSLYLDWFFSMYSGKESFMSIFFNFIDSSDRLSEKINDPPSLILLLNCSISIGKFSGLSNKKKELF
jgi:hypothetical protein